MKCEFTTRDGKTVTATADDGDLVVTEVKQGADDFIMIRCKPGTLKVSVPSGTASVMRFDGAV